MSGVTADYSALLGGDIGASSVREKLSQKMEDSGAKVVISRSLHGLAFPSHTNSSPRPLARRLVLNPLSDWP